MAIIKCKMCGGDIELSADKSYGVCEFCGSTMTLPKVDDEQRAAAFNRGNHFRRIGEFDKALTVYETLVRDDEADAEAHWCCALCRFGIEYVKDPASGEYIPTCHRASFDSFLEDVDTKAAIEHADAVVKCQYEHDAQIIEEVRRGILTLSQNEKPYDVFICYKETDDKGQRTIDSQRAQEIYYQLTDQGWRVFFARITLEDKAGQQYEPYIFAALNSAKVMIVVGTRREHLEAVWVKNEWSRFLAIMKRDRKKLLIPCYADMDPYDMPEQLSVLQSYDMTKIGFIQDLTRSISKVLDADKKPAPAPASPPEQPTMSGNVKALLKRGYMALEDADWERADEFFEQVLNQDAECAEAYWGKALAEQRAGNLRGLLESRIIADPKEKEKEEFVISADVKRVEEAVGRWEIPNYLTQSSIRLYYDFRESYRSEVKYWTEAKKREEDWWSSKRNLVRARKYASGAVKQELEDGYKNLIGFFEKKIGEAAAQSDSDRKALEEKLAQFNDAADKKVAELYAIESRHREKDYADACKAQAEAEREEDIKELEKISKNFAAMGDFKDCEKRHDACPKAIDAIDEKRRKEEADCLARKKRRKKKRAFVSFFTAICLAVAVVIGLFTVRYIQNLNTYKKAESLVAEGKYDEAVQAFTELGNFKDAADRVNLTKYEKAEALLNEGNYDEAVQVFTVLGNFKDAADRVKETQYKKAETLLTEGNNNAALEVFMKLGMYKDSPNRVVEVEDLIYGNLYKEAEALLEKGEEQKAAIAFGKISVYKDSALRSRELWKDCIVPISGGFSHTIGLKSDGTVVAEGSYESLVSGWSDIIAVSAGYYHIVGLKSDGTVVAVDPNIYGEGNVSGWSDIVAISAGHNYTIGLKSDGTVVAEGSYESLVSGWSDIIAVSAGDYHIVGLKSDGTAVAVGNNTYGQCSVSSWTDVVAISAGYNHTVGLKSDGTVVAVGADHDGQCDVSGWTDIVAISAGRCYTVGLKSDGTVVAVGDNSYGQCNVSDWTDIWVPER